MATPQMANVSIAPLVEAIEKRRAERESTYVTELAEYKTDHAEWCKIVAVKLTETAARVKKGDVPVTQYGELKLGLPAEPSKPRKPDFERLDRDLKSLKIISDDSIKLKTDSNYFQYL